ncbi:MAG: ABC transporter ATP-binding protein [Bacteroidaceae bacterium]|nr:ABC transporter ATP-binding protein [Bacteroidaceae bacterium]
MRNIALAINDATIGYRNGKSVTPVVTAINATLCAGEVVALIGMNGAGKSTLLRTLSAFQPPLSGRVEFEKGDIGQLSSSELARCVSVVLTENNFSTLSVNEVVSLGRTPYTGFLGRLSDDDKAIVAAAMERMGVLHLAEREYATLSDGEKQKSMIAKAIAQQTPLMLLDEPTAFLDFRSKVQLFRTLRTLAADFGKAVVVSTHDIEMALRFADKLWLIDDGHLYEGSTRELAAEGLLQRVIDGDGMVYDKENNRIEITR